MTDDNKNYRVADRRHSASEGEPSEAAAEATPTAVAEPAVAESATAEPEATFLAFVLSLGAQASLLLGGAEGAQPELKGARWLISLLEMLKDKTEGRRTEEETEALSGILYQLRMAYVQRARAGGA